MQRRREREREEKEEEEEGKKDEWRIMARSQGPITGRFLDQSCN